MYFDGNSLIHSPSELSDKNLFRDLDYIVGAEESISVSRRLLFPHYEFIRPSGLAIEK